MLLSIKCTCHDCVEKLVSNLEKRFHMTSKYEGSNEGRTGSDKHIIENSFHDVEVSYEESNSIFYVSHFQLSRENTHIWRKPEYFSEKSRVT